MDIIRVAVDAMGGDHAPEAPVRGAIEAVTENEQLRIILLGDEPAIRSIIGTLHYPEDRVTVQHCTERIEMAEPPVAAIQKKKDSSIVRGMMMLRRGEADAFVSAGSTGAVLVGGQVLVGRIRGVERPPLGALMVIPVKAFTATFPQGELILIERLSVEQLIFQMPYLSPISTPPSKAELLSS